MQNFEAPFLTYTNPCDSPNFMGTEAEWAALDRRVDALDHALRTGKDFDTLLDMLAEDGQDPCEYVERLGHNIEIIIANGIVPDDLGVWQAHYGC